MMDFNHKALKLYVVHDVFSTSSQTGAGFYCAWLDCFLQCDSSYSPSATYIIVTPSDYIIIATHTITKNYINMTWLHKKHITLVHSRYVVSTIHHIYISILIILSSVLLMSTTYKSLLPLKLTIIGINIIYIRKEY